MLSPIAPVSGEMVSGEFGVPCVEWVDDESQGGGESVDVQASSSVALQLPVHLCTVGRENEFVLVVYTDDPPQLQRLPIDHKLTAVG